MSQSEPSAFAILGQPRRWFVVDGPVSRGQYATLGLSLGVVKYAIEFIAIAALTGHVFTPSDYINPWLNSKASFLNESWGVGVAWLLFTLPFVMIAVSMSIRRAADAGWSPWWGLSMLVPPVNLIAMSVLSIVPQSTPQTQSKVAVKESVPNAFAPPAPPDPNATYDESFDNTLSPADDETIMRDFWFAIFVGVALQVLVGLISVWVLREYGMILFFATPFFAGAVSGALFNTGIRRSAGKLFLLVVVMNIASYAAMLTIGLDGAICLFMAFPLLWPLSFFGALAGRAIMVSNLRDHDERRGMRMTMLMLPMTLLLEPLDHVRTLHRVDTAIVIDAPVTQVWDQVIAFPEITERPAWFFRAGIAAPIRARIEGSGVGACRYCEFTTGPFVEPITTWSPPASETEPGLLAFDVESQPLPMEEWTPFSGLHPPHLDEGFVSRKGQFLLQPIRGDAGEHQTRLIGTTWYDIDVRPRLYWKLWADPTIHAIHDRVLSHIKRCTESDTQPD